MARYPEGTVQTFDFLEQIPDTDPADTARLVAELERSVTAHGPERARVLLLRLPARARDLGVDLPSLATTPYINTIKTSDEPAFPGDEAMETRIRHIIRWNAAAMVLRANKRLPGIGGHLATYASAASLYEVGYNHFFRGKEGGAGDQIFYQGHAAPGIYARAYLEGRLSAPQLDRYRREQVRAVQRHSRPHSRVGGRELATEVVALLAVGHARGEFASEWEPAAPRRPAHRHRHRFLRRLGQREECGRQGDHFVAQRAKLDG